MATPEQIREAEPKLVMQAYFLADCYTEGQREQRAILDALRITSVKHYLLNYYAPLLTQMSQREWAYLIRDWDNSKRSMARSHLHLPLEKAEKLIPYV